MHGRKRRSASERTLPRRTDQSMAESEARIRAFRENAAPYPYMPGRQTVRASFQLGQAIRWTTIGGDQYEGIITDIEEGVARVNCDDGQTRAVELD